MIVLFLFLSPGPSELDLSLLGETSSLADVACKYDEVRVMIHFYSLDVEGDLKCCCQYAM